MSLSLLFMHFIVFLWALPLLIRIWRNPRENTILRICAKFITLVTNSSRDVPYSFAYLRVTLCTNQNFIQLFPSHTLFVNANNLSRCVKHTPKRKANERWNLSNSFGSMHRLCQWIHSSEHRFRPMQGSVPANARLSLGCHLAGCVSSTPTRQNKPIKLLSVTA